MILGRFWVTLCLALTTTSKRLILVVFEATLCNLVLDRQWCDDKREAQGRIVVDKKKREETRLCDRFMIFYEF